MEMQHLSASETARKLIEEGRLASKGGDTTRAEVLWKQALGEASEADTFDCGGMFLASVYLAFLYLSRGQEHDKAMQDAVQDALCAYQKAFQTDKLRPQETPVPVSLSRILNSLNELCPGCYSPYHAKREDLEEEEGLGKLCYTGEEIRSIGREMEPSSEDCTTKILAAIGYESIDIRVDVHPDNLRQPNRKKGGDTNTSHLKKKKKKNNCNFSQQQPPIVLAAADNVGADCKGQAHMDVFSISCNNSNSATKNKNSASLSSTVHEETPSFNSNQALAWADALETNITAVLGAGCVLLTDHTSCSVETTSIRSVSGVENGNLRTEENDVL